MPHATDGELHAWLDGALDDVAPGRREGLAAHLDGCADCRARLEEARAVRGRAGEILEAASPGRAEPPPFADVLAERERRRSAGAAGGGSEAAVADGERRGARTRRTGAVPTALAWAASVALAVGVGWVLRSAAVSPDGSATLATRPPAASTEAGGPVAADRSERPARVDADAAAEAPSREAAGAGAAQTEGEGEAPADRGAGEQASTGRAGAAGRAADRDVAGADAAEARAAAPAPAELRQRRAPGAAGEAVADAAGAGEGPVWVEASREDVRRWLGAAPLAVAGLPVRDLAVSVRGEERVVRVRQALPSGGLLELVEAAAGAPATGERAEAFALAPPPAGARAGDENAADAAAADTAPAGDAAPGDGVVSGRVVGSAGAPLEGVQVYLPEADRGSVTDAGGRYTIAGIPAGRAAVAARLLGFRPERRELLVPPRDTARLDFRLESEPVALQELTVASEAAGRAPVLARGGVRVTARGDLPPDSLRALLDRLEPLP